MGNQRPLALGNPQLQFKAWNQTWVSSKLDQSHAASPNSHGSFTIEESAPSGESTGREAVTLVEHDHQNLPVKGSELTFARFIEQRFIPEHVALMGPAGRDYFQAIIKHVVSPERVDRTLHTEQEKSRTKLKAIPGWPYLDDHRLCEVQPDHVQQIITAALARGYSIQTVTHIRNVVRKVFSHARSVECFMGENPATSVALPQMAHKPVQVLGPDQLRLVIQNMRHPERDVALLGILTGMSVAEIFGLQWKYVNLSDTRRLTDDEWLPPRVIAVRKQSYRSQIRMVTGSRRRDLPISELTVRVLQGIKTRKKATPREGYVFSSRSGTPINQDNIAARRLKHIGKRLEMPWLSWNVFHRSSTSLPPEFRKGLEGELKDLLFSVGVRESRVGDAVL